MRNSILSVWIMCFLFTLTIVVAGCKKDKENGNTEANWDIDKNAVPKFVSINYIELSKIYRISRFRSSFGHDYSDFTESCRSMKHYFEPRPDLDWTSVSIYAPVSGKITQMENEWAGTKIEIQSTEYPAFRIQIFHVNIQKPLKTGDLLSEGEFLGNHTGNETMSDISVIVNDVTGKGRMVSYFSIMNDDLFETYRTRGINSKDDLIISKESRDADPLNCDGTTFTSGGSIESWMILNTNY